MHTHRRVGAPCGGRVHWLLYELQGEFLLTYDLDYNYSYKNYFFSRKEGWLGYILIDCFIVSRTSKHCYKASYYNAKYNYYKFFSATTAKELAQIMKNIYFTFKDMEDDRIPDCYSSVVRNFNSRKRNKQNNSNKKGNDVYNSRK